MEFGDPAIELPARFADLKKEIASLYPDFEARATKSWREIIKELGAFASSVDEARSSCIPSVNFKDLDGLDSEVVENIRKVGTVVIRDIVEDAEAIKWREALKTFVKDNADVEGTPPEDKQFFQLYWTRSQVQARSHPHVLATTRWLNELYHVDNDAHQFQDVDLKVPLIYADRFRIRHPGSYWPFHPPHTDGGSIERWEDPAFRKCFEDIFRGDWRKHDPYELRGRLDARSSLYQRPNQSSLFRTFQGWLAMSETAPGEGTLNVFPNVQLSNAYTILRPFFRPLVSPDSPTILEADNWVFDLTSSRFAGIYPRDGGYAGPRPTAELHPHLQLDRTMVSIPKVYPGDAVFWHCDVVHSVDEHHRGKEDSAVMYIPAVPLTKMNLEYVQRQKESFLNLQRPPDFPRGIGEEGFVGVGKVEDISSELGRIAMGFEP